MGAIDVNFPSILPHNLRYAGVIRLVFHVFSCYRLDVLNQQIYDEALAKSGLKNRASFIYL